MEAIDKRYLRWSVYEEMKMAASVESMMYVGRTAPWHGLGVSVAEAPTSKEALVLSGLDWKVVQKELRTVENTPVPGFRANLRETDNKVLGVVTDRYKVVQNEEAFAFTDELLGEGVRYETAGSLQDGKKTWLLARLPHQYIISGDQITPYLVFMNSHDGTSGIKVAMTPVRVVCQNTLNLALNTAKRSWTANHVGNINGKLDDARNSLLYANQYMCELGKTIGELERKTMTDKKVLEYFDELFPSVEDASDVQKKNILRMKNDLKMRYFEAPDLKGMSHTAYRVVLAVSDFATHAKPLRETSSYRENLFARTVDGNALIDKTYAMMRAA